MLLSLVLLMACSGCLKRAKHEDNMHKELDVNESFCSAFDEESGEFASTELDVQHVVCAQEDRAFSCESENSDGFKTVYFDFNSAAIAKDQKEALEYNIELAKAYLQEDSEYQPTIVVEGHACHSKGQSWYNDLISKKRAAAVCDAFVKAGVPADCIKVVARGAQVPAIVDGESVSGDKLAQAPNRRCEIKVIYA
jgi:outer membrane protein OmpA-like peptidoglycan-associated protein